MRNCLFILAIICAPCHVQAALSDSVPEDEVNLPALKVLTAENEKKAQAMTDYMAGLLDEEAAGPEKAFESYRRVLNLDPGFSGLAVYVAHEHMRRGEYAEAIGVLKDALKVNPKDATLCLALSSIYLRQLQKPDLAYKYAQLALEIDTKEFAAYEALWEIYQVQGQRAKAKQVIERAIKSKSTSPQFWLQVGRLMGRSSVTEDGMFLQEDLPKVTPLFEKALEYADGDFNVMARVADFFTLSKQPERAIPIYERILKIDPDFERVNENLGICYSRIGRMDEAIAAYEKAVEKEPTKIGIYDEIAELSIQKEDYLRALNNLRQALILDPSAARYDWASRLALKLNKPEDALFLLNNARMRFSMIPDFTYLWAVALSQAKRHDESMRAFEQAILQASNVKPGMLDARFYMEYGIAAQEAKLYARAEEMFRKSIEMDPVNPANSYNCLGYMWVERGENLEEAERMIRKALELDPENAAYIDSLGWALFKQNKYPEALVELLRASEKLPKGDAVVYEHIGDTYQKMNQHAQAVLYWQKSAALNPDNKELLAKIDANTSKIAGQAEKP